MSIAGASGNAAPGPTMKRPGRFRPGRFSRDDRSSAPLSNFATFHPWCRGFMAIGILPEPAGPFGLEIDPAHGVWRFAGRLSAVIRHPPEQLFHTVSAMPHHGRSAAASRRPGSSRCGASPGTVHQPGVAGGAGGVAGGFPAKDDRVGPAQHPPDDSALEAQSLVGSRILRDRPVARDASPDRDQALEPPNRRSSRKPAACAVQNLSCR